MSFSLCPALNYSTADLAALFNRGFEDYFFPVNFTEELLSGWIKNDDVSLAFGRVLLNNHSQPVGLGLVASRGGYESRLAAMGIIKDFRGCGAGSWFVEALLDEARARGERRMLLEVIAQNEPGVRLYKKFGFKTLRQLFGFRVESPAGIESALLKTCELSLFLEKAKAYTLPDLPWQVDESAVKLFGQNISPYCLGESYIAITDPSKDEIIIRALYDKNGGAEKLLKALFATFPEKRWRLPAIFPEEQAPIFENVGMDRDELSQWQMVVDL